MSSGNKKQETAIQNQTNTAVQQVAEKTPEQIALDEQAAAFRRWKATPGQDITSAPGMSFAGDIYGNASRMAAKSRIGSPGNAFTANLPGFNNQLNALTQENLYNTRAQGISNAFAQTQADALNAGAAGAAMDMQRRQQYANASQGFYQSYINRPIRPPLWQQIAGVVIGGAKAGAGLMTGGAALANAGGIGSIFSG